METMAAANCSGSTRRPWGWDLRAVPEIGFDDVARVVEQNSQAPRTSLSKGYKFFADSFIHDVEGWLVGLDLFNDDTCPSGHISRPTQENVSQELFSFSKKHSYTGKCVSELLSVSKQLLQSGHIVHVWGLVEVNK